MKITKKIAAGILACALFGNCMGTGAAASSVGNDHGYEIIVDGDEYPAFCGSDDFIEIDEIEEVSEYLLSENGKNHLFEVMRMAYQSFTYIPDKLYVDAPQFVTDDETADFRGNTLFSAVYGENGIAGIAYYSFERGVIKIEYYTIPYTVTLLSDEYFKVFGMNTDDYSYMYFAVTDHNEKAFIYSRHQREDDFVTFAVDASLPDIDYTDIEEYAEISTEECADRLITIYSSAFDIYNEGLKLNDTKNSGVPHYICDRDGNCLTYRNGTYYMSKRQFYDNSQRFIFKEKNGKFAIIPECEKNRRIKERDYKYILSSLTYGIPQTVILLETRKDILALTSDGEDIYYEAPVTGSDQTWTITR